jgi:hypothetical protein
MQVAGLFAVAAATLRQAQVIAVEGDRVGADDLVANAAGTEGRVKAVHEPVEVFTARQHNTPSVVIVDPPRTGMSKEALDGANQPQGAHGRVRFVRRRHARARRSKIVDAGYTLEGVAGFDLFPNTPHRRIGSDVQEVGAWPDSYCCAATSAAIARMRVGSELLMAMTSYMPSVFDVRLSRISDARPIWAERMTTPCARPRRCTKSFMKIVVALDWGPPNAGWSVVSTTNIGRRFAPRPQEARIAFEQRLQQ